MWCPWYTREKHIQGMGGCRKHSRGRDLQGLWCYAVLIIATFYAMVLMVKHAGKCTENTEFCLGTCKRCDRLVEVILDLLKTNEVPVSYTFCILTPGPAENDPVSSNFFNFLYMAWSWEELFSGMRAALHRFFDSIDLDIWTHDPWVCWQPKLEC